MSARRVWERKGNAVEICDDVVSVKVVGGVSVLGMQFTSGTAAV